MSDVLVVGGGPAGMAAACAAIERGASVTLVDAGLRLGGQLLRQPVVDGPGSPCPGLPVGPALPTRFRLAGHPRLEIVTGRSVWSISGGRVDGAADEGAPAGGRAGGASEDVGAPGERIARQLTARIEGGLVRRARAVVLATGASELLLPFPGWELPGVVSAGAAQSLVKAQHQLIGGRILVAGCGPFLLPVAAALSAGGAEVIAVLEAQPLRAAARMAPALLRHPAKLAEAGRYGAQLARRRVALHHGWGVLRAEAGDDGAVASAVIARLDASWHAVPGSERRIDVDAVCVSFGFVPRIELARQLGVAERASSAHPVACVRHDADMATSVPGVFVAGELTGIAGGEVAEAEGTLAGAAAAASCGLVPGGPAHALDPVRRRLAVARRFADRLERVYRPTGGLSWAGDDTVVCRCEDVPAGALRAAIAGGARSVRELRSLTRCGMGYCQGRTCGPILQLALSQATGIPLEHCGDLHQRPVAVPVPLAEVAAEPD